MIRRNGACLGVALIHLSPIALATLLLCGAFVGPPWADVAHGGVVVLVNQARQSVQVKMTSGGESLRNVELHPGAVQPFSIGSQAEILWGADSPSQRSVVQAYGIYAFMGEGNALEFNRIELGPSGGSSLANAPTGAPPQPSSKSRPKAIRVKILVDQNEPATAKIWEPRLRERVAAASAVIERYGGPAFEVVAVGTWEADKHLAIPGEAFRDFQRKVSAAPAQLAIGFSRLCRVSADEAAQSSAWGSARGTHLLIPDIGPKPNEAHFLKVLVHQLGHYLGATHSPEPTSIMRRSLGSMSDAEKAGRLAFDPINTLILSVGTEEASQGIEPLSRLSPAAFLCVSQAYWCVADALPGDPTANAVAPAWLIDEPGPPTGKTGRLITPELAAPLRRVVDTVCDALAKKCGGLRGDEPLELCWREGAAVAKDLPADQASPSLVLGMVLVLDSTGEMVLRLPPEMREAVLGPAETWPNRRQPLNTPLSAWGRPDLPEEFARTAWIALEEGAESAVQQAMARQVDGMVRGGRWSFPRLAAAMGGAAFAEKLHARAPSGSSGARLAEIARDFAVSDYLIDPKGLPAECPLREFCQQFGRFCDERFQSRRDAIRRRLQGLAGYRSTKTPRFQEILVPDFPGAFAIQSGTTRDAQGRIWLAVSAEGVPGASAHLMQYDPDAATLSDRGDVVSQLRQAGLAKEGECQGLVLAPLVALSDGCLYFASVGEEGAEIDGNRSPRWGSHVWRVRPSQGTWEHVAAVPEGLVALAGSGTHLYGLAYPGNLVYRFETTSGKARHAALGTVDVHVGRGLLADARGHVYAVRVQQDSDKTPGGSAVRASLVEMDENLREIQATPLDRYQHQNLSTSPGIVGQVTSSPEEMWFATEAGGLYRIGGSSKTPGKLACQTTFDPSVRSLFTSLAAERDGRILTSVRVRRPDHDSGADLLSLNVAQEAMDVDPIALDEAIHDLKLAGQGSLDESGSVYLAGWYERGPIEVPPRLLKALTSRGASAAQIAQLQENARRARQPILVRIRRTDERS